MEFEKYYRHIVGNGYDFGTGTWAVVNNKIKMKLDQYGEYHPIVEDGARFSDRELRQLKESCLSLSSKNESDISNELFSNIPNINHSSRLGYYSDLYVGHVCEGEFRKNGSSGGFGTWILSELLKQNLVDYVINVHESEKPGLLFEYTISNNVDGVWDGAKTKYYPVQYSDVIKEMKRRPGRYAIIGLPSYVMEMRLMADNDAELNKRLKYTVGLICGHQKSSKFAEFLAWQCGIKPGDLEHVNFRKKIEGKPSNEYGIEFIGKVNGKKVKILKQMKHLVGNDWGQGFFKVHASDFTDDVMNETADVTLGDAWLPQYTKDSGGNNVVIVRNPVLADLIKRGINDGRLGVDKVDENVIFESQSSHYRQTRVELGYRLFKNEQKGIWIPQKRVSPNNKIPWIRKKIQDMRQSISVQVPVIYAEAVKKNDLDFFLKKAGRLSRKYKNLYRIQRVVSKLDEIF